MKLMDMTLLEFQNAVDSDNAVPGGGSVSAFAGSLGAALGGMVGKLTLPKKKFLALDESIKTEFMKKLAQINQVKHELSLLVDKDTEAYQMIMDAYKLPKVTEGEVAIRNQKILEGTKAAIKVPFQVAMISLEAMTCLDFILTYGNQSAASDLGVAGLMLLTALEGALMNVRINLPGLDSEESKHFYRSNAIAMIEQGEALKKALIDKVMNKIGA